MIVEGKMFPYKHKMQQLFDIAGDVLKENFDNVNVSVNFVSVDEIKNLNNKFRQIDRETDVLSFPNLNKKYDQPLSEFIDECDEDGSLFLGDIVICKKIAFKQAKDYGHSRRREICFLALHGLLHLLGYDHIEKDEEKIMMGIANKIMEKFGVNR